MDYCSNCGKPLPEGAQFCPFCGIAVQAGGSTARAIGAAPATPRSGIDALGKDVRAREYWAKRLVAFVIDAIIVGVVIAVVTAAVAFSTFDLVRHYSRKIDPKAEGNHR
ncbi:MAG: zinc ribbon domain-containing protein [Thaumarchaeota archaeon]|nr:zinc ribbon domain-containing protein [Nitrososphaerota archaeon]